MKKRLLAVFLALALCVGLTVPAFAAGTKKVVENTTQGLKITMDGFLRLETHRYNNNLYIDETGAVFDGWTDTYKIYVVADNSTVTVEALPEVRRPQLPGGTEGLAQEAGRGHQQYRAWI